LRSRAVDADFDVAVAGFGPCGAACTALLGSLGVRTLAVERSRGVYDKPRAFALDHEIMRVFQNLGLAGAVAKHTAPFTPSEYYGADGQLIKRLGSVAQPYPLGWPPNMVFTQPPVEEALRRHAAAYPGVEVALGSELVDFEQTDAAVTLRLRDDAGRERRIRSSYLVGCDGASSTVRRHLGVEYDDLEFDEPWLVVDLVLNERGLAKLPAVSIQYCEPSRPATYLIGPGAHRRWEIMLLPGEDRARMESEAEVWRLLARWISPGDATLWRVASYRFHALVTREWRRGRVFLAGDAAHQQPPFTGQGMCQGVRDVANLAWKLRMVLQGEAGDGLLDSYGSERGPHVRRLTSAIKEIGRLICERDPVAARARDARLLEEAGGKIVTMPRQQMIPPLEKGFLSRVAHPANGSIFPQPRIKQGERDVLLDDIAGGGFLIAVSDGFPAPQIQRMDLAERIGARVLRVGVGEGCLRETDAVVANWFERNGCSAAIVRPDHYVYGVARDGPALDRQLEGISAELHGQEAFQ
jgi:3-(3-hydroxy-phenyl)propionate hydroxylase